MPLPEPERRAAREALASAASSHGLELPAAALPPLADYLALLVRWRRRRRLTGPADIADLAVEVAIDALCIDPLVPATGRLFDIGSGAGFPGLPLALLGPARRLSLVEPAAPRAALLRLAVATLRLDARVLAEPVERVSDRVRTGDEPPADAAMARAFLPPDEWLAVARPLVRPGGTILVLAGASWPGPRDASGLVPAGRLDYALRGRRPRRVWAFRRTDKEHPGRVTPSGGRG
ncbi:MAG: class I SAM-dependent methyltransferase [Deltaproteobacteria bacterium]|nr:class I SAM-dependent methyltransferase [Deltaproteobacteria bacterium]